MVIPIVDIIALQPQKAFRFGHHGLAIIIKGHEELFMEFSSAERRDACKSLLDGQADELQRHKREPKPVDPDRKEAKILQDLDASDMTGTQEMQRELASVPTKDGVQPPPVMFTSTSSSFLDFKPKEPMHITCLTIGSRGDVQPCASPRFPLGSCSWHLADDRLLLARFRHRALQGSPGRGPQGPDRLAWRVPRVDRGRASCLALARHLFSSIANLVSPRSLAPARHRVWLRRRRSG